MSETSIEWTDQTWNAVRGCARVSPGCESCYAERQAHRFSGAGGPYEGLTVLGKHGPRWSGRARFVPEMLDAPLRWKKPVRVFVNSMSDLFHADLADAEIDQVLAVMLLSPRHTFQVLTKRPERMRDYLNDPRLYERVLRAADSIRAQRPGLTSVGISNPTTMPARWIWWGVSAEDQKRADERIPLLLQCPAAVRFVSAEPLLGPVDLSRFMWPMHWHWAARYKTPEAALATGAYAERKRQALVSAHARFLDWVIVGGESGPGARPCDVRWIRSIVEQCAGAGVPVFCKQLGGNVFAPWKLAWSRRLDGTLDCFSVDRVGVQGTNLATVWRNGTWHTWDAHGTGGENSHESDVEAAKREAVAALVRQHVSPIQGWAQHKHMLADRKGGDPTEWPEDLRVRQFPQTGVRP